MNILLNKGIEFEVEDTEFEVKKRFWGLLKKRIPVKVRKQFKIGALTAGTLDRMAGEWIEIAIDESAMKSDDAMQKARTLVHKHVLRCARIVAIAVLDSDYLIPRWCGKNGTVRYDEDRARLESLAALFARTLTPSDLYRVFAMINVMCDFGNFVNSIRLMSSYRSTMPDRIEENREV